jgi:hypothetical protein
VVDVLQATLSNAVSQHVRLLGFGVGSIVHVVPSHVSANGEPVLLEIDRPTAAQEAAVAHETAFNEDSDAPLTLAVDSIDQPDPFHSSDNV